MGNPWVGSLDRHDELDSVNKTGVGWIVSLFAESHSRSVTSSVVFDQAERPARMPCQPECIVI
jgi:hypothetical protein